MRTSLNNIKTINDYLLGQMESSEAALFEANTILNSDLADDVKHQQNTYSIIKEYSRQQIKAEIVAVQKTLATAPQHRSFMQHVATIFKKC